MADGRNNSTVDNLKTRVALLENILSSSGASQVQAQLAVTQPAARPIASPARESVGVESSGLTPFLGSSPETSTSQSGGPSRPTTKRMHRTTSPHDEFSQPERLKVCLLMMLPFQQLISAPARRTTDLRRPYVSLGSRPSRNTTITDPTLVRCATGLAPEPPAEL